MRKLLKIIGWLLLIVVLAALPALAGGYFWYRAASQPQIAGTLKAGGAGAPLDIVRDAEGVPHIYAASPHDAYFGLGFAHAQDRLWQMELNRRVAAGRTAEILGAGALDTDRFLRSLGVRRNAEAILANVSPDTRDALEAYAQGVNSYLAQRKNPLPPEFLISGAPPPEPWQPADSIAWQTMIAWDLGANWSQELLRMRLSQRLTLDQINQFLPPYPGDAVLQTQDYTKLYRELSGTTERLAAVAKAAPPSYVDGMGSNNWVLSGSLTTTGKPLLANDPHLGLAAPGLWYFAHMSAPGLNVIGVTLPGIPGVVLGRTDRIAWGFTNTAPDVQDLYIERINPAAANQYQTPQGWAEFKTRKETIKVKGQPDVTLEVRETRHGPVISGALPIIEKAGLDAHKYVVAFAWTALRPDDMTVQAGIKLNRAANWQEFLAAARDFGSPQQNMVYADVLGNIGFVAPARVPIRKPENDLHGLAPAPGWDSRYDWDGFIPFEDLPRQFNPASHRIATANEKIVGPHYPHFLTSEWHLPYRARRIASLLDAKAAHDMKSMAAIQRDHVSLAAREALPVLLKTVPRSERAKSALEGLAKWDGAMAVERWEPLLFTGWMREASRAIFADELGEALMKDYWEQRNVHQPMLNVLRNKDGQGAWCRDVTAPASAKPQTCADLLAASLETALDDLQRRYGADRGKWRWGHAHAARFEHRPFGKVPLLNRIFDIRIQSPGDTYTVNVGRHNLRDEEEPFTSRHAAGYRALYDLSDLENSRFIQATGQSGNVLSPLYRSYSRRWSDAEYIPMQMKRETVEMGSMGTLRLQP
jgi:penicillin amidase